MDFVDVHAHLESSRFDEDLDEVVERARKIGVKLIINSGVNVSTNRRALMLTEKYPDIVKASFGIYPIDSIASELEKESYDEGVLRHVEAFDVDNELKWIEKNKDSCIAIGEVGLDYKVVEGEKIEKLQKDVFKKVIALAKKIKKPLVIHSRKAEADAIELLESSGIDGNKVLMHCFNGKKSLIKKGVELGFYFSVPPVITRLDHFKMMVEIVPLKQLLTETDSPYLSPVAGERNEPANVVITINEIAKIKGMSSEEVSNQIYKNARDLFGK